MSAQIGISYTNAVPATVNIACWAVGFDAYDQARRHKNLSTSGLQEVVYEASDVLCDWTIPALLVGSDYEQWATFFRWAAQGGTFNFAPRYPASSAIYHATLESDDFKPKRVGPGRYSLAVQIRIVPDGAAPADAGAVMHSFYGLS